jgi:hypothetical protein
MSVRCGEYGKSVTEGELILREKGSGITSVATPGRTALNQNE